MTGRLCSFVLFVLVAAGCGGGGGGTATNSTPGAQQAGQTSAFLQVGLLDRTNNRGYATGLPETQKDFRDLGVAVGDDVEVVITLNASVDASAVANPAEVLGGTIAAGLIGITPSSIRLQRSDRSMQELSVADLASGVSVGRYAVNERRPQINIVGTITQSSPRLSGERKIRAEFSAQNFPSHSIDVLY